MPQESQAKKDLENKNGDVTKLIEWATEDTENVDDMIALFGSQGVSYSAGEEITHDYKVVTSDEKQLWLNKVAGHRTFVVKWEFYEGSNGEFAAIHVLVDGFGKFIFNDGAKSGVYGQLSEITTTRIAQKIDESHAKAGLLAERGFKKNKPFEFDTRTGKAIKKNEDVPAEFRKPAHPTWKLDF